MSGAIPSPISLEVQQSYRLSAFLWSDGLIELSIQSFENPRASAFIDGYTTKAIPWYTIKAAVDFVNSLPKKPKVRDFKKSLKSFQLEYLKEDDEKALDWLRKHNPSILPYIKKKK
jgi:hypothetical protein